MQRLPAKDLLPRSAVILSAPRHGILSIAILCGLMGVVGMMYEIVVALRMLMQTAYEPVLKDWLFHILFPFAGYAILAGSACAGRWNVGATLIAVAAATPLLLFVGIHNAWDVATYHISSRLGPEKKEEPR